MTTPKTYRYVPPTETDRVVAEAERVLRELGVGGPVTTPAKVVTTVPDMVTVAEAAEMLRRSTRQIHRYIASGRLTATQATHGGHLLIPRTEIERLRRRKR